jgi:probable HAF family extracellular repeat protein
MFRYVRAWAALCVVAFAGAMPAGAQTGAAAPRYRLTVPEPQVVRINNLGQGIGDFMTSTGVTHGFIETDGRRTDLGSLGGYSHAGAINDRGHVAGTSLGVDGRVHLFLYANGAMRALAVLGENPDVRGINNRDEIVGNDATPDGRNIAWKYAGGVLRQLAPLDKFYSAYVRAINDRSQAVGWAADEEAVVWEGKRTRVFGPLIGSWSFPEDINDRGDIVGSGALPGSAGIGDGKAFLFSNGRVTDLGTLGGPLAYAYAINNLGQIVGGAEIAYHDTRAFLYRGGRMVNLNDLIQPGTGWTLEAAVAINDRAQILAWAFGSGGYRIVRLEPVQAAAPR